MKQKNFLFKSALLLVALFSGASASWADGTISIPQDLGSFIPIGTITNTSGVQTKAAATGVTLQKDNNVDGSNGTENTTVTSYTIGSTNDATPTYTFALTVSEAADFLFSFKSGHGQGSAEISLTLKNSSDIVVWNNGGNNVAIPQTGSSWTPTTLHAFDVGTLAAGNYTMTLRGVSKSSGSYYGNYGNFSFHTPAQYTNNWNNTTNIIFTDAGNKGNSISNDWINSITKDSYVEFYTYTPAVGFYFANAKYGYATEGTDNFTMTITDVATSTIEVNAANYKVNGSEKYPIANSLATGWKKIRIDYPSTPVSGSFRCQGMKFAVLDYDTTPLTGTATLRLNQSQATFYNCSYEDKGGTQAVASIKGTTPYADNYYINNTNETAYYDLYTNISYYKKGGTLKVTVTDVATGSEEATGTSDDITATGVIHFALDNSITAGIKKIRFDFINASVTDDYLYNISAVSFYKRSLNETYDYSPVAATSVDVVLTRNISANSWSTIMLPFDITASALSTALGTSVTLATFSGYSENSLVFSSVDAITANTPCMIKVGAAVDEPKTITGVNIVTTGYQYVDHEGIRFQGVYESTKMDAGDYFVSSNKLYKATASTKNIKPFRAYFKNVPAGARLSFFDDETTGISEVNGKMEETRDYYNLSGQRVAQPTKGLYIVNGKKIIIK